MTELERKKYGMIHLFQNGIKNVDIYKILNVSRFKLYKALREANIPLRKIQNAHDFFLSRIKKVESGCWEWQGPHWTYKGYGLMSYKAKTIPAHRYSYQTLVGEIDGGLIVCHRCDNPKCCNPQHLFLGTYKDNMRDMYEKKRGVNSNAKLTPENVKEIRKIKSETGMSNEKIGLIYKVTFSTIGELLRGETWRDVV